MAPLQYTPCQCRRHLWMLPKGAYNTTLGDYRFEVLTLAEIVDTMSESVSYCDRL